MTKMSAGEWIEMYEKNLKTNPKDK
jgi:hypothetical protein